jgi:uncharacterized membrane protein
MGSTLEQTDKLIDVIMGRLLRLGVVLAALVVFLGGVIFLTRHPAPVTNYHFFQGEPEEFRAISGIFHEALAFSGRGLIQLGLLILIATPIARVAFSALAFFYERDWKYVVFTLVVLGLLLYSLSGGRG